ncbi:DUF2934 domain-containing protein [Neorhizobium sp. NCHU2750]|uniref:DUF2934 domain-containing protein n=1 Tax=Neorhizobium sp. NCHU2750 TaxID=1825976 RepID=UPI000E76B344|nr:hypothetical protein NCHU2750_58570 [Neorhizobium sp. NCHU2750]
MSEHDIREAAYRKWESEGRPEGEHERHWREAEDEHRKSTGTPQTMPSDHNSGVAPPATSSPSEVEEPSNDWPAADKK